MFKKLIRLRMNGPGSPREKSIVSLISDGLKLEFAAGDPAGGLRTKLLNCLKFSCLMCFNLS